MAAAAGALFVFPLVFLRSFAYSGIAVVLLAGAAALIVLPAVLALLGPRINALTVWRRSVRPPRSGFWSKSARAIMRRPVVVIVAVGGRAGRHGRAVRASPIGLPRRSGAGPFGSRQTGGRHVAAPISARGRPTRSRSWCPTPARPRRPSRRPTPSTSRCFPTSRASIASSGIYVNGTRHAAPPGYLAQFSQGDGIWYSVVPMGDGLSPQGEALVHAIRDGPAPFAILVGGTPASLVDSTAVIDHYLPCAVLIVVGATFLILLVLFRSAPHSPEGLGAQCDQPVGHVRRHGVDLPRRPPVGAVRLHADGDAHRHHAHLDVLRRLRAVDGLRGLPGLAHEGAPRQRGGQRRRHRRRHAADGPDHHRGGPADEHHLLEPVDAAASRSSSCSPSVSRSQC